MSLKSNYKKHNMLNVIEDAQFIFVEGETFKYSFSKKSGLISNINILGNDFLQGTNSEIPDIFISNAESSENSAFSAKYENEAECEILSANPYEVHIRSHGIYRDSMGKPFPARYRITYEIESDGTIFIIVDNKITNDCEIRWLCISRGKLDRSLCGYFTHLADQSKNRTIGNYIHKKITEDGLLFNGEFIPWCWFGNDESGIEISVWDVGYQRYGTKLVSGKPEENAPEIGVNIYAKAETDGILWEIMAINGIPTKINSGWEHTGYFTLSITPPKHYNSSLSDMHVWKIASPGSPSGWAGSETDNPSEDQIRDMANKGFDLMILPIMDFGKLMPHEMAKSVLPLPGGTSLPLLGGTRVDNIISTAHKYGFKVIPSINIMEIGQDWDVFDEHAVEWRIEPSHNDNSTILVCPGAEGWREYWKSQIDKIIDEHSFDGIFLDLHYDRLACRNPLHGCRRKYIRPTFIWVREMIKHAYVRAKSKSYDSIVIANTDLMPLSMICAWVDARCVGNYQDIIDTDIKKAFYSSYRLGCNSLMKSDDINQQVIANSLLYMSFPVCSDQNLGEVKSIIPYWDVFRFFGVHRAKWWTGFSDNPLAVSNLSDIFVNIHKHESLLLTLINLSDEDAYAEIEIEDTEELNLDGRKQYMVYEPLAQKFNNRLEVDLATSLVFGMSLVAEIFIPKYGVRLFVISEKTQTPTVLFAMGSDGVIDQAWDEDKSTLKAEISARRGAQVDVTLYFPSGKPFQILADGKAADFVWDDDQKLVFFTACPAGKILTIEAHL
ncbi:MAG: hypothetical protein AAB116_13600 [Candidatus Poribacteria bacterium]